MSSGERGLYAGSVLGGHTGVPHLCGVSSGTTAEQDQAVGAGRQREGQRGGGSGGDIIAGEFGMIGGGWILAPRVGVFDPITLDGIGPRGKRRGRSGNAQ